MGIRSCKVIDVINASDCIPNSSRQTRFLLTHVSSWLQPAALTPQENQGSSSMDAVGQIAASLVSTVQLTVAEKWCDAHKLHEETLKNIQGLCGRSQPCSQYFTHILASVLTPQGRWQQAECILGKLLQFTKAKHAWYHLSTITCMDSLATVLQEQGKWEEAEDMHRKVLEARRNTLGEDHNTLSSMNNLANVLQEQGKWQEAEDMHRKVLEARRITLGEGHPDTLLSMNNLANVLQDQGKWQEAKDMYNKVLIVLEARRRTLGEDHHDTLMSMNNLAIVLSKQGKWQEAEDLHNKVLEARGRTLGEDHPDTLGSMNNLAGVLQGQGKWQEAEDLHRKVLETRRSKLGEDHHDTLLSMSNLATVLQKQQHHETLLSTNNLASGPSEQGKWQEAEGMHRKVVDEMQRTLGEDHNDILRSLNNLANVLREQGKWQEAEDLHRQVLGAMRRTLGENHPDALQSRQNLARVLRERGQADPHFRQSGDLKIHRERLDEAISSERAFLEGMQTRLKDEHNPDLVRVRYFLAKSLVQSGSLKDAEQLLRGLVDTMLQKDEYIVPLTRQVIPLLVSVLEELGQTDEAELCLKVLEELLLQVPEDAQSGDTSTLDEFSSEEEKRLFEEWSTSAKDEVFWRDYVENKMDEVVEKFTSSDHNGSAERSHVGTESSLHLASTSSG